MKTLRLYWYIAYLFVWFFFCPPHRNEQGSEDSNTRQSLCPCSLTVSGSYLIFTLSVLGLIPQKLCYRWLTGQVQISLSFCDIIAGKVALRLSAMFPGFLSFEEVMCLVPARDIRVKGEGITSGANVNFFTPSFPLYQSNAEEQNDLGRHLLKMVELQGR